MVHIEDTEYTTEPMSTLNCLHSHQYDCVFIADAYNPQIQDQGFGDNSYED